MPEVSARIRVGNQTAHSGASRTGSELRLLDAWAARDSLWSAC